MDYNARYYSPSLGRFISPDSIVPDPLDSQTFNRYAYGYNNPLKYTDPSGHSGGISDFLLGVTYEVTSNNYDGLLIPSSSPLRANAEALATSQTDNIAFQSGRIVGGIASAVQGTAEIIGGAGTFVGGVSGGIITSPTGVGIAAGVGVAAVGAGVAAHGAGTFFHGVAGASEAGQNIFKAVTGGGGDKPPNLSPPGAGRNGAFRQAKRDMGIPVGQEPSRVLPNTDRRGELQPGRVYEFEVPAEGGGTKMIRIREDSEGHFYGDNDPQNRGPHFNTPDEGHYDY